MTKITLTLVLLFTTSIYSQDLLINGDLELWSNEAPDGWSIEDNDVGQETVIFNEGANSAVFTPQASEGTGPSSRLSQTFILDNQNEYVLKFDYFVPGTDFNDNSVTLLSFSLDNTTTGDGFLSGGTSGIISDDSFADKPIIRGEWTSIESEPVSVLAFWDDSTQITIKLTFIVNALLQGGSDVAYIDNISFEPVDVPLSTSRSEINNSYMYPNPTTDKIFLENYEEASDFQIFNSNGKLITQIPNLTNQNYIDVKNLTNGIYVLRYSNGSKKITHKFVKN